MIRFPEATTELLSRALEIRLQRQQVLAGNVANADTPGYTPLELDFARALAAQEAEAPLARTDPRQLAGLPAQPEDAALMLAPDGVPGLDGNSVVLEREMAKQAENTMLYQAANRALLKKLGMLRYAVSEGGAS
jgi:flagellar basal-body rod protein FlgB